MLHVTEMISFLFWLGVIPFCIGLIPANFISSEKRNPGVVLLAGYFGMWALFEIAAVPAVLWVKYDNFRAASAAFTVLALLLAAAGLWLMYRNYRAGRPGLVCGQADFLKRLSAAEWAEWLLFFLLLGFQMYKAAAFASFDGDDAYYVVESLIAQESDVMYRILPYTGRPTDLDVRHALAVFPMWVAFVSVKAGVHATIVSHVAMPLLLIPLTYLLYYEIGRLLFGKALQTDGEPDVRRQGGGRRESFGRDGGRGKRICISQGKSAHIHDYHGGVSDFRQRVHLHQRDIFPDPHLAGKGGGGRACHSGYALGLFDALRERAERT
ncbi:MAG: hypothetical protein K1W20_09635 [Lachnospiraceae bacterium]